MSKNFREALLEAVERTGVSLRSVATGANVSYEQLKKLSQGKSRSTNVDDAIRVAHFFGMSLDEFIGDETQARRKEILDLYSQLSDEEQSLLKAAALGFLAQPRAAD